MKRTLCLLALFALLGADLVAQDASATPQAPAAPQSTAAASGAATDQAAPGPEATAPEAAPAMAFGLPLLGTQHDPQGDFLVLQDGPATQLLLKAEAEPDEARMNEILALSASLRAAGDLVVGELRVVNQAAGFQAHVVPTTYKAGATDLAANLPAGLLFYWSAGSFDYDVRLLTGKLLLRIKGVYTGTADLGSLLSRVLANPSTYVASLDPLLVQQRLQDAELKAKDFADTDAKLRKDLEAARAEAAGAKAEAAELRAYSLHLASALITTLNGGKAVRDDAIAKVMELRRAEPKLDKAKLAAKLKDAGLALQPKELDLIMLVLFGEK